MLPHVPVMRTVNNQGDGTLFEREDFRYEPETNTYTCPGEKTLRRKKIHRKERYVVYEATVSDCGTCSLKPRCTLAQKRSVSRHLFEDALNRMQERVTPAVMRLRRCTVEHPSCNHEVPHLRTSAPADARVVRCTGRNRLGNDGLQHQTHDECARRGQPDGSASLHLMGSATERKISNC